MLAIVVVAFVVHEMESKKENKKYNLIIQPTITLKKMWNEAMMSDLVRNFIGICFLNKKIIENCLKICLLMNWRRRFFN